MFGAVAQPRISLQLYKPIPSIPQVIPVSTSTSLLSCLMDPLSVTASIIAVVTAAATVIKQLEVLRARSMPHVELMAIMNLVRQLLHGPNKLIPIKISYLSNIPSR